MHSILDLIVYLTLFFWIAGLIILFISQQKESIIHKQGIYPDSVNKFFRPWGLKIKELERVQNAVVDEELKMKLGQVIYLRRLGFRLLFSIPLIVIAYMIIRMLIE